MFLGTADASGAATQDGSPAELLYGAALVAPIALYGLWLLRKPEFRVLTDGLPVALPASAK